MVDDQFEQLQKLIDEAAKALKSYNELLPGCLRTLANHGWYFSVASPMWDGIILAAEISKGNHAKVDRYFMKFYDKEADRIIRGLCLKFPERNNILKEALKAHKQKMYYSSTSLFISLSDGLCSGFLFSGRNQKRALKKRLDSRSSLDQFLSVIFESNAIDVPHHRKKDYSSDLNRHGVMHGIDVDFGTRVNSLRALSLLAFIGEIIFKYHK